MATDHFKQYLGWLVRQKLTDEEIGRLLIACGDTELLLAIHERLVEGRGGGQGGDVQENDGLGGDQPTATGGGQGSRASNRLWNNRPG